APTKTDEFSVCKASYRCRAIIFTRISLHSGRGSQKLCAWNGQRDRPDPVRPGGEFFTTPGEATQRRYEALRAYFVEEATAAEAAARVGWATETLNSAVRDVRAGRREFFVAF